jgi:hypothetical protein
MVYISWFKHKGVIVLVVCIMFNAGCEKEDLHKAKNDNHLNASNNQRERDQSKLHIIQKNRKLISDEHLRKFASDFENSAGQNTTQDTLAKQKQLALAAIPKIGAGDELLAFLDYLTERGAGDLRKEVIEKHLGVIFTGPDADKAREWLLSLEDEKLRETLSRQAGEVFSGPGFKDYFEKMGEYGGLHSQPQQCRKRAHAALTQRVHPLT